MNLTFTFNQNNLINPQVGLTYIDKYYTSPLKIDSDDTDSKAIIKILKKEQFIDEQFEHLVTSGLEKTFNIAKFGLNDFSKEISTFKTDLNELKDLELKQWSFSSFCALVTKITVLAATVIVVLGLVWVASVVLPISSPFLR